MEYLSEQLNKFKSDDKNIYKILYKIRTQYSNNVKDIEILLKHNLVRKLAELLGKRVEIQSQSEENNKIIEIILSILANCTYNNKVSAVQVYEENVVEHIMTIINKSDNPVLMAKSCRLLGNLLQNEKIGLSVQQSGAALSLSNCVSEKNIPLLLSMSIRAIRLMWSSKKFRLEITSLGTIFKIIACLRNALKKDESNEGEEECMASEMVILKRESEPDRLISKEKLSSIIQKMEKHNVETNYEILKPERNSTLKFSMPTSKENSELVSGILKLLLTITTTGVSSNLITQIAKSIYADGIGIDCLLFLIEKSSKFRVSCLKILSNLSYSSMSQEFLGVNNDLIPKISSLLMHSEMIENPLEKNEQKYCLEILCLSTENSCNRLKLKRSGVFKTMLNIASMTTTQDELNLLIFAFFQYRYDEDSLNLLIQLNLINVLIKLVANIIENKEVDHINDSSLDESERKEEQKLKNQQQRKRPNNEPLCFTAYNKFMRFESSSPSSSGYGGSYQYSPSRSSTDGYSPYNSPRRCYQDYNSDSNEYSPVCSDNDEKNDDAKLKSADFDILKYIYENDEIGRKQEDAKENSIIGDVEDETTNMTLNDCESDEENECNRASSEPIQNNSNNNKNSKHLENVPETLKSIEADRLQYLLLLLWKVSINHSDALAFVNTSNLATLIKVFGLVKRPNEKIYQILQNIVEQTRNFVPIFMRQDFLFQIFEVSNRNYSHLNCYSCDKMKSFGTQLLKDFRKVAESGYGEGEITHCLMQSDVELKKKTAIKLTYVISSLDILSKFLFHYGALNLILDAIFEDDHILSVAACNGITILSNNLNIKVPSEDDVLQRIIPDEFIIDGDDVDDIMELDKNNEQVKFILNDGEISFDKEILKTSSLVFNSMLSGNFRESNKNEVSFPNYTVMGMKYFFQLVKMDKENKIKPIAPKIDDIDVVLQAYELSILYILTNIQQPLLNVIKIILDERNVRKIFEWSIRNINQDLLISSICFYLCEPIAGEKKLSLYLDANSSQYNKEWRELIVDSILMKCKPADD